MNPISYILGFLCGLVLVVLVALLLRYVFKKKNGVLCGEYDERQKAVQGCGYKYAYFTLLISVVAGALFDVWTGVKWIELFPFAVLCLWISLCVFVTYCISKDAYVALQAKRKVLILIFAISALVNLGIALMEILCGDGIITDGCLNLTSANLFTGAASLQIAIALCIRAIYDRVRGECE